MKKILANIKEAFSGGQAPDDEAGNEEYVELDTSPSDDPKSKIIIKPYTIDDFSDVSEILEGLRAGFTIALINIKPLKEKDLVELKRAINKLKKTVSAIDGDIAGFGDDWIVAAPSFAEIQRNKQTDKVLE